MTHAGIVGRDEPVAGAIRVANSRYRIGWQYSMPAARDDLRCSITFEAPELPMPLRFYFLPWTDDEGRHGYMPLGHAWETGPVSRDSLSNVDLDDVGPSTDEARWVKENLNLYRGMAERAIAAPWDSEGVWKIYRALRNKTLAKRTQGKPWSDEELTFAREAVEAGEEIGLSRSEIATQVGVERTTLWRALTKAREKGLR